MASVKSNVYEGRYLQLDVWEISTDPGKNSSLVGWKLSSIGGYSSFYYIADTVVSVNGQAVWSYDAPAWDTNWATKTFPVKTGEVSGQLTVPHNADGKKAVSFQLSTRVYISTTPADFGGTLVLTTLTPAQPSTVSAADMTLAEACNVTWIPGATNLYYKLMFVVGTKYQSVWGMYPNRLTQYTYRGTILSPVLAQGLTGARSAEMTVTLTAHTDYDCTAANQVGSASTATCTVTVPATADFLPGLSMTLSPVNSLPEAFSGLYIQGMTGVQAVMQGSGKQNAVIQAYTLQADGTSQTSVSSTLSVSTLNQYGSQRITGSCQDSRGFTASVFQDITVIPYIRPKVQPVAGKQKVIAQRCDADGNPDDSGTWLKIAAKRSYSPVIDNNTQKNYCLLRYRYREDTASSWSNWVILLDRTAASDEVTTGPLLGSLLPNASYQVQIQALDDLGETASTTITVSTEKVYSHKDGARGSFGFGKLVSQEDVFDIAPDKTLIVRGGLQLGEAAALYILNICHPVGSVLEMTVAGNPGQIIGGIWNSLASSAEGVYRWVRVE